MGIKKIIRDKLGYMLALALIKKAKSRINSFNYGDKVLSIYAHHPDDKLFERTIVWLKKHGFNFISTEQLEKYIDEGKCPKKQVWLSFDDGCSTLYPNTINILKKHNVPATIFVNTKAMEEGYLWFNIVRIYKNQLNCDYRDLWKVKDSERKQAVIDLAKKENVDLNRDSLTIKQVKEIAENDLFTIANHTDDHVIMDTCNKTEIVKEIDICEDKLKLWNISYLPYLAYPNGNVDEKVIDAVKQTNIKIAATTVAKPIVLKKVDKLLVPRVGIMDKSSLTENICHIFGVWQPAIKKLKKLVKK